MPRVVLTAAVMCVAVTAGSVAANFAAPAIEVVELRPTVFFPRGERLTQIARLVIANREESTVRVWAEISLEGGPKQNQDLGEISPGKNTRDLLIPDIESSRQLHIALRGPDLDEPVVYETIWKPQRHWVIYLVKSSHSDLGYETTEFEKRAAMADYIDKALAITDDTWSESDPSRYRWTIEHLWWLRGSLDVRSWQWYRRLLEEYVKPGKTALTAAHCSVHPHWHDLEQLCRSMYWSRRHLRDQFDLDLPLYYIVDNPSVAWPVAQAWALAGGRYVIDCRQSWRTKGKDQFSQTGVPKVFWWLAPDRKNKVLFTYPASYGHGQGRHLFSRDNPGKMERWIEEHLREYASGALGDYPYDLVLLPMYGDYQPPSRPESDAVVAWNNRWRFPELRIDDPARFMAEMERRFAGEIPTLTGDMNNYSGDYAAAKPDQVGAKRAGSLRLATAETFASIARAVTPGFHFRQPLFDDAWRRLCEHDDHTWPTGRYPLDHNEVNYHLLKTHNARAVARTATEELHRAATAIARRISAKDRSIVVFNPLPHSRSDVVRMPRGEWPANAEHGAIVEVDTGRRVPVQVFGDEVYFLAEDVPATGYRTYRCEESSGDTPRQTATAAAQLTAKIGADGVVLENDYYRVRLDRVTGVISELHDKRLGRNLVDTSAKHGFNQFIYDRRASREGREGAQASPSSATLRVLADGPVVAAVEVETEEPKSGAGIRQIVRLYRNVDRVEIEDRFSHVRALWAGQGDFETSGKGRRIGKRYLHNVFVAFPFNVPGGTIRAEYSIGTVRPHDDQLRLGSHDYLSIQQYVNCSNDDYGVTWTAREASCVHFGEIRYNCFSNDYRPAKPWLYSYAMSNRMAGLGEHHPDRVGATLHYTVTAHRGGWATSQAARDAWAVAHPMTPIVVEGPQQGSLPASYSFVSVDAPNVRMSVLKPSELPGRGYILRLLETQSRELTKAHVRVPCMDLANATWCNLVEDDRAADAPKAISLDADGRGFYVMLGANELATIRLVPKGETPAKVGRPRVDSVTDSQIRLSWPPVQGAVCYRIYRLPSPEARPALENLVTETLGPSFEDEHLDIGTDYVYCVSAVGGGNLEGNPSDRLPVQTSTKNSSPPAPVREPIAVERNCRCVIMTWRSNAESDVASYRVFRGDTSDFPLDEPHLVGKLEKPTPYYRQWFTDPNVEPGRTYYYRVVAVDTQGLVSRTSTPARISVCEDPETK